MIFLLILVGVLCLGIPPSAQAQPEGCAAWAETRSAAIARMEDKCDVTFREAKGHSCEITPARKYMCTTGSAGGTGAPAEGLRNVWSPSNNSLTSLSWAGRERVSYDAAMGALKFTQHARPNPIVEHRSRNALWVEGTRARMSVEILIPSNFDSVAGRLAIGLYGSSDPNANYVSGGGKNTAAGKTQNGFSVRINYGRDLMPNIYAYNLNRPGDYGSSKPTGRVLPKNQWITLVLDVVMNTPGLSNGSATFTMYDSSGRRLNTSTLGGMVFRRTSSWTSFGAILTEKTHGDGPAPKTQSMYYRKYRMYVGG